MRLLRFQLDLDTLQADRISPGGVAKQWVDGLFDLDPKTQSAMWFCEMPTIPNDVLARVCDRSPTPLAGRPGRVAWCGWAFFFLGELEEPK